MTDAFLIYEMAKSLRGLSDRDLTDRNLRMKAYLSLATTLRLSNDRIEFFDEDALQVERARRKVMPKK